MLTNFGTSSSMHPIHWGQLILSIIIETLFSIWIKLFDCGIFLSLIISFVLFLSMYLGCLIVMKEDFVIEVLKKVLHKLGINLFEKKKELF